MFDLPVLEAIVLGLVVLIHAAAGAVAALQLVRRHRSFGSLLALLILTAVLVDAILLGLRAVSIEAVPLTGLFDSLIMLALVFGVLYLVLRSAADQVWFSSVMVWVILCIILAAGMVAKPASRPQEVATTPWAVAHAAAMILAAASITFAAANSALVLLSRYRLKHKGIMQVLGRIPNMETLVRMNRLGVRAGFVLLTLGLISGLGMVSLLGTGVLKWLTDGKVICIVLAWGLLGLALILDRKGAKFRISTRVRAYITLVAFVLILVATVGVTVAGVTQHKFSRDYDSQVSIYELGGAEAMATATIINRESSIGNQNSS